MKNWLFLDRKELVFLFKFLAIFFSLFYLLKMTDLNGLQQFIASIEFSLIKAVGIHASQEKDIIFLNPQTTIQIVAECSGFVMIILLAALLWSTKISNRKRIEALFYFAPALFVFNIFRLWLTILALAILPAIFEPIHVVLWFVDSAVVMYIWMHVQGFRLSDFRR